MFFYGQGEGEELFDVLLDAKGGVAVEPIVVDDLVAQGERGIEAEIDADVAVAFVGAVVELRAEADDADAGGFEAPGAVELRGQAAAIEVVRGGEAGLGHPEAPAHFELVGGVLVELFGGFGDGVFDAGGFGVVGGLGAVVVDVDALVHGGFGPVDGKGAGGVDARVIAAFDAGRGDLGELAQNADYGLGQRGEAKVRVPETQEKLVGHGFIVGRFR